MNNKIKYFLLPLLLLSSCAEQGSPWDNFIKSDYPNLTVIINIDNNLIKSSNFQTGKYKPGETLECSIYPVTDISTYLFLNNEKILSDYIDGYDVFSFTMPDYDSEVVITHDKFYVDREYKFSELFYWINSIDSLIGIEIESGYIGIDPATANPDIKYSEDIDDLEYNINILKNGVVTKLDNNLIPPGGWYMKVTYYFPMDVTEEIEIANDIVTYRDFSAYQYFKINKDKTELPKILS